MDLRKTRRITASALMVLLCGLILIEPLSAEILPVVHLTDAAQREAETTDEISETDAPLKADAAIEPESLVETNTAVETEILPEAEPLPPPEMEGIPESEPPLKTEFIPDMKIPLGTEAPAALAASDETPTPDAQSEPDEEVPADDMDGIVVIEEEEVVPTAPGDVALADCETPTAKAGGQLTLAIPIRYTRGELVYETNVDASGQTVPADGKSAYDQALTDELAELSIAIAHDQAEDFPLNRDSLSESRTVIADGQNRGYAVFEAESVRADAAPGEHPVNFQVTWRDIEGQTQSKIVSAPVRITPFSLIHEDGGIIVFTFSELRQALQSGQYSTVYLGYCDADVAGAGETKNGGRISYTDLLGIDVSRNITIDGTDPRTRRRVTLIDHTVEAIGTAIRANANGITITLKNVNVEGNNYYGIITNSGHTNVQIRFEDVVYKGRQIVYSVGSGSTVSFKDCTVTITGQEVVEAGGVYFSGTNTITKTESDIYSLFWLNNTPRSIVVEAGAKVTLTTPNYVIFTGDNTNVSVTVNGTLNVETNGNTGCMTYAAQYINDLSIHGALNITHNGNTHSSIRANKMTVTGALDIDKRTAVSAASCIEINPTGGSIDFQSPVRVSLKNAGDGVIRNIGTGTVRIATSALNSWRTRAGGSNRYIWNNNDLSTFTVNASLNGTSTASASATGLSGGTGVSLQSATLNVANFNLYSIPRLEFGRYAASIDAETVYATSASVSGTAPESSANVLREYRRTDNALLQSVTAIGDADYRSGGDWEPISSKDSRVYLLSETDNLEAHIYQDSRDIYMIYDVPPTLDFGEVSVSADAQLVGRQSPDWTIQILDTRATGHWILSASAAPLRTQDGAYTLPNALVHVESDGTRHPLSQTASVAVAQRSATDTPGITDLTWAPDEGLHLFLDPGEGEPGAAYATTIVWTLDVS